MGDIAINCEQITQTADAPPFVSYHHDNIHGAKAWYEWCALTIFLLKFQCNYWCCKNSNNIGFTSSILLNCSVGFAIFLQTRQKKYKAEITNHPIEQSRLWLSMKSGQMHPLSVVYFVLAVYTISLTQIVLASACRLRNSPTGKPGVSHCRLLQYTSVASYRVHCSNYKILGRNNNNVTWLQGVQRFESSLLRP